MAQAREHWKSRWGFLLASVGAAVGLGNIWRFPYIMQENGGGAFMLVYLLGIFFIGMPVLFAALLLGRATQHASVSAYRSLSGRRSLWPLLGWMGALGGFFLLSFYSVVGGWICRYLWMLFRCEMTDWSAAYSQSAFQEVYSEGGASIVWMLLFMVLVTAIVYQGVNRGLEFFCKWMMPLLGILLLLLFAICLSFSGFSQAFRFLFHIDFSVLTPKGVQEALGHSFFTLSVGLGSMVAYGSYLPKEVNLVRSSIIITLLDTAISLLVCLVIFPISFTYNMEAQGGPGLLFINLPVAMAQMLNGKLFALLFFFCVFLAALTSAINILELVVACWMDERGWTRKRTTLLFGAAIILAAIPAALSGGASFFGAGMEARLGMNWFDLVAYIVSDWMLPLGGCGIAFFSGWRLSRTHFDESLPSHSFECGLALLWRYTLRYFAPWVILLIFARSIGLF